MKHIYLLASALLCGSTLPAQITFDGGTWYGTTGDSAIELFGGDLSLRSGTSGRGIHSVFSPASLTGIGDSITASFDFTTPATVGTGKSASFRAGFFNSARLPIATSTGNSSSDAAWSAVLGYMTDFDVNTGEENINFREKLTATGSKLLGTTSSFDSIDGGGSSYSFVASTSYSGEMSIELTGADELTFTTILADAGGILSTFSATSTAGVTDFDMLAFHVNSNTFGSTNSGGSADNGIDFQSVDITASGLAVIPEPSALAAIISLFSLGLIIRRRR